MLCRGLPTGKGPGSTRSTLSHRFYSLSIMREAGCLSPLCPLGHGVHAEWRGQVFQNIVTSSMTGQAAPGHERHRERIRVSWGARIPRRVVCMVTGDRRELWKVKPRRFLRHLALFLDGSQLVRVPTPCVVCNCSRLLVSTAPSGTEQPKGLEPDRWRPRWYLWSVPTGSFFESSLLRRPRFLKPAFDVSQEPMGQAGRTSGVWVGG